MKMNHGWFYVSEDLEYDGVGFVKTSGIYVMQGKIFLDRTPFERVKYIEI